MKTLKLVLGILAIVLAAFVLFQSCAATTADVFAAGDGVAGASGTIVAAGLLASGIVMIAARNAEGKIADIICAALLVLVAIVGFTGAGFYTDLIVWSVVCLILAVICIISACMHKKPAATENQKKGE